MLENRPNLLAMEIYPRGGIKTTGRLCISSNPSGALIYIDGIVATNPQGEARRTSSCIDVQEGRRDITLRLEGYADHTSYADIFPSKTTNKYVNIESERGVVTTPLKLAGLYAMARIFLYNFF